MIMYCKCGETLSNGEVPNSIELWVYTDKEWEEEINIGQINSVEIPKSKYRFGDARIVREYM